MLLDATIDGLVRGSMMSASPFNLIFHMICCLQGYQGDWVLTAKHALESEKGSGPWPEEPVKGLGFFWEKDEDRGLEEGGDQTQVKATGRPKHLQA
jgi:hypothetical protein